MEKRLPVAFLVMQSIATTIKLSELAPGHSARVVALVPGIPDRKRMLDLGFVPGTEVRRMFDSPLGDPIAFEVRGTVIALRRSQADGIEVSV